ncbi:Glyoxylate reductase/hydroxypyruvate reductase [Blattella germanica]|nr:Glyoxylate reductase/hydroxypyruvate reductase [Blattella germanica]
MHELKPRVFVTCVDFPSEALQLLQEKCEVLLCEQVDPTKEQVHKMVKNMDALLWFWFPSTGMDKALLDAVGPSLKAFSLISSGHEHVDMNEVKRRGIKAGFVPFVQDAAVADIGIALLLAVAKRLQEGIEIMATGTWDSWQQSFLGLDIYQSTVGIIGLGGVGKAIAKRIKGFEVARLLYSGPSKKSEAENFGAEYVSFDEILRQSDYIFISCRLNTNTKGMFNDAAFDKMKPNAILINIGRGGIIDQEALIRALEKKKIWGAGLDVMTPEPLPSDSSLLRLNNCVITPHIGSATKKTRTELAVLAAKNILAALDGKPMPLPLT